MHQAGGGGEYPSPPYYYPHQPPPPTSSSASAPPYTDYSSCSSFSYNNYPPPPLSDPPPPPTQHQPDTQLNYSPPAPAASSYYPPSSSPSYPPHYDPPNYPTVPPPYDPHPCSLNYPPPPPCNSYVPPYDYNINNTQSKYDHAGSTYVDPNSTAAYDYNYKDDGVYAYQAKHEQPYGASSKWSGLFDDYGRPISFPSNQDKDRTTPPLKVVRAVPKLDDQTHLHGGVQKFKVKLLPESASQSTMDVLCMVGLDGIRMLDPNTARTLRIYPLHTVTRCDKIDSSTFAFWSKTSVDIDPRRIRLHSNTYTTNTILDTVTAATVQVSFPASNHSIVSYLYAFLGALLVILRHLIVTFMLVPYLDVTIYALDIRERLPAPYYNWYKKNQCYIQILCLRQVCAVILLLNIGASLSLYLPILHPTTPLRGGD